jgi:hypothetical protein
MYANPIVLWSRCDALRCHLASSSFDRTMSRIRLF